MKHEIWDNYLKIVEEQDSKITKQAQEIEEHREYKNDPAPRASSETIDKIEKKYNTKPDVIHQYKHNITEIAHPSPVIIAPSYDKLNGLVENDNERQFIMMNIVNKPTDGITSYRKYAEKELLMELVRLATDFDNQGNEPLRSLADDCITELSVKKKS